MRLVGKLLLFCVPFLAGFIALELRLRQVGNSYVLKKEWLAGSKASTQVLFLGDSQMEQGIQATAFTNGFNAAFSSQPIYYDSVLLAYYQPKLQLKQVVVSLGIHRLQEGRDVGNRRHVYDALFTSGTANPAEFLRRHFYTLQLTPREAALFSISPMEPLKETDAGTRIMADCRTPTPTLAATRVRELSAYENPQEPAQNLRRLVDMQARCQQKGIAFTLLLPPVSAPYFALQREKYQALYKTLSTHKVLYIDFTHTLPDSLFTDADHPCSRGAAAYTQALKTRLTGL